MQAVMASEAIGGVMMAFEHSGLGHAARSTGWLYPLANLVHVLGAALVVGASATFDIHVLRSPREAAIVWHAAIFRRPLALCCCRQRHRRWCATRPSSSRWRC